MKPINAMTKKELLSYAEREGFQLSSATRLNKSALERAIRKMMQNRNRASEN